MNSKLKRKVAEELLMILISLFICFSSFAFGLYLDNMKSNSIQEKENEINFLENKTDSFLLVFRKNIKVDSILKLQWEFHTKYKEIVRLDSNDSYNHFFWINVRNSIKDSTFNLTYASDEIIEKAVDIKYFLSDLKNKRTSKGMSWDLDSVKNEFKYFAMNNNYERFLPEKSWNQYHKIRKNKYSLSLELISIRNSRNYDAGHFFMFAAVFCFAFFFMVRYFIYLLKWSIINLKK
jgi:hypothetical protein